MNAFLRISTVAFSICLLGNINSVKAQKSFGRAYYVSHKKMKTLLDSTKYDKETIDKIQGYFSKQFQKDYVLEFNTSESMFSEQIKLNIYGKSNNSEDKLFKNFSTMEYIHKKELLGKVFSIQDSIKFKKWKISNDTKGIGKYICNKATLNHKINDTTSIEVEAWFTSEIPISNGPSVYDGLTGLILQINDGTFTYLCKKIEFSDTEIKIKKPRGGKVVNQADYDKILKAKLKEGRKKAESYLQEMESSKQ